MNLKVIFIWKKISRTRKAFFSSFWYQIVKQAIRLKSKLMKPLIYEIKIEAKVWNKKWNGNNFMSSLKWINHFSLDLLSLCKLRKAWGRLNKPCSRRGWLAYCALPPRPGMDRRYCSAIRFAWRKKVIFVQYKINAASAQNLQLTRFVVRKRFINSKIITSCFFKAT